MLACLHGVNGNKAVRTVRGADMNGLNALVLKHFFIIGIHLGTLCAKLLAGLLRTLFNYIAEAYNLNYPGGADGTAVAADACLFRYRRSR